MSDLIDDNHGGGEGKHGQARAMVEAALRARRDGATDLADRLLDEAQRADPEAVADLLMELEPGAAGPDNTDTAAPNDRDVELISRTMQPHSDAPSRSGITGSGSGADGQ